ncbi:MAG TPA: diguanylate cyclase, partial [Cellvibrio sp.]|nr:diguanylate cyclase [Cellvibrio sp.]
LLALVANFILLAGLAIGAIKSWSIINWLDFFGEGIAAVLTLLWLLLILQSRPAGRVTHYLALGLSCVFWAQLQDFLDEIIMFPKNTPWVHWVESGLMPLGLSLLTLGIYYWHKEQLVISAQLCKRERLFREHQSMDFTTSLGAASYLRKQLEIQIEAHQKQQSPISLLFIDIDNFSHINRQYGSQEGDRLLQELSELILLNIRRCDLLCRYAGDRFALLLPNTGNIMAETLARELGNAVRHFAFKTSLQGESLFHSVSIGLAVANNDSPESLIERAHKALLRAKEKQRLAVNLAA